MAFKLVTPPAEEPLSLNETKGHLRVDIDDDDNLILALIVATRQFCEDKTHRLMYQGYWITT